MPYRGLEHSGPACFRHASAPASETCARCLQPICEICVSFASTQPHCPLCAREVRRAGAIRRAASVVLTVGSGLAAMGAIVWIVTRERPFDYGVHKMQIVSLKRTLQKEPCDRTSIVALTETMLVAGDPRGALDRASEFFTRCGAYPRLLWVTYAAHERLSEHEDAIIDATLLIHENPADKDYWWWRAIAHEAKGNLKAAVDDYERSLEVEPRLLAIPFNLANVYERLERPCDARRVLQKFLRYHGGDLEDYADVERRVARLAEQCTLVDTLAP